MNNNSKLKVIRVSPGNLNSCWRGVYYEKKAFPKPLVHPDIASIWQLFGQLMEMGKRVQQQVRAEWQNQGVLLSSEKWVPWNDFGLSGRYDAICKVDGKLILYEIKGVKLDFLNFVKKTKTPREEHRKQLIIYHFLLKKNFPQLEPHLLYVDRKMGERYSLPIQYQEDEVLELINQVKELKRAIDEEKLPKVAETVILNFYTNKYDVSMQALTCKYHALCLEDDHWYEKAKKKVQELNEK